MKKHLFSALLSIFTLSLGSLPSYGQGYYETGKEYVFRSLHQDKDKVASILTVKFDEGGTARISRVESPSQSEDQHTLHVLAPLNEIATVTTDIANVAELEIRKDVSQYWLISLDNPGDVQFKSGDKIEVSCECTMGNGVCDVSYTQQGNNLNATCVPGAGCQSCKMTTTVVKNNQRISGGVIVLKAGKVIVE